MVEANQMAQKGESKKNESSAELFARHKANERRIIELEAEIDKIAAPFDKEIEKLEKQIEKATKTQNAELGKLKDGQWDLSSRASKQRDVELSASWVGRIPTNAVEFGQWLNFTDAPLIREIGDYRDFKALTDEFDEEVMTRVPVVAPGVKVIGLHNWECKFYLALKDGKILGYFGAEIPKHPGDWVTSIGVVNGKPVIDPINPHGAPGYLRNKPVGTWVAALKKHLGVA